jgi:hypothetical protein
MNTMKTLNDLLPLVQSDLPGIDSYTFLQHAQQAVRQYCSDTDGFREKLAPINLVAAQNSYVLTPSWDCRITKVDKVWLRTESDVTRALPGHILCDMNWRFFVPDTLFITPHHEPRVDVDDGLVVKVVLVPDVTQTGNNVISLEFFNTYAEAICQRLLYTLKMMPRENWTDLKLAQVHLANYHAFVTNCKNDEELDGHMNPPGFGA